MLCTKMHKLLNNSVGKLKCYNLQYLIAEKSFKNVVNRKTRQTASYSTTKKQIKKENKFINFDEMITRRRAQAQKSILVQVSSEKSFSELQKYCCQFGTIIGAHHYGLNNDQFILVEYSNEIEVKKAIENSTYNDASGVYVQSPFLWFRAAQNGIGYKECKISGKLITTDGCRTINYKEINESMLEANTITDQMLILYNSTVLNDLGIRLRFLAAQQIEQCISGMFPNAQACLFGSSVNGCGKLGCDLDLILRLNAMESESEPRKRLVFHTKQNMTNPRSQTQRHLENLSDIMQLYLPGVSHIRRILQARVPIVRYHHEHLDLEVDLSMNNMSGVYMSELLYMFAQIDERVSPLVFNIRRWAQTAGLTNHSPGVWISNFSVTCLVIFYLQQLSQPVLPSIDALVEQARVEDKRIVEDGVNSTFLRDLNLLKFNKQNDDSLDQLLIGFFEFYSQMNFVENAISLNDAKLHIKPDHSAVHIINPLEPILNVSKNVSFEECERFRIEVRNAAWILESAHKKKENGSWGLLNLFQLHKEQVIKPNIFFKSRMVDVKELFDGSVIEEAHSKADKKVEFKNLSVKNEVAKIQRQGRMEMSALKSSGRKR